MQTQLMLDHIQDATATANTVAKQEREALTNLETALREADETIQRELNRILTDQMMRRAEIMTALDKIKSGLGRARSTAQPRPRCRSIPKLICPRSRARGRMRADGGI